MHLDMYARAHVRWGNFFPEMRLTSKGGKSGTRPESVFRVGYPKKPEPEVSGPVRVGFDFLGSGFFRVGYPKGVKIAGRVGFQIFGFFDHPNLDMGQKFTIVLFNTMYLEKICRLRKKC